MNLCARREFLKQGCRPCVIVLKSCYIDYRINKPSTCSRCLICVSYSVHVISTYYVRKASWPFLPTNQRGQKIRLHGMNVSNIKYNYSCLTSQVSSSKFNRASPRGFSNSTVASSPLAPQPGIVPHSFTLTYRQTGVGRGDLSAEMGVLLVEVCLLGVGAGVPLTTFSAVNTE